MRFMLKRIKCPDSTLQTDFVEIRVEPAFSSPRMSAPEESITQELQESFRLEHHPVLINTFIVSDEQVERALKVTQTLYYYQWKLPFCIQVLILFQ